MNASPTVIARFLDVVLLELRSNSADGAAQHTYAAAGIHEPADRAARSEAEQARLLLLADRAARRWTPMVIATLQDGRLDELAAQQARVTTGRAARDSAGVLGALRMELRGRPTGPLAATPELVAKALASLEAGLRHVADGRPDQPQTTAVVAVPHFARGLVGCFSEGASFDGGIPGETAATVQVLDSLDGERQFTFGTPALERTAAEGDLHRTLVSELMSRLAMGSGHITHAQASGTLPQPPKIGRHRPDLLGTTVYGGSFIGEAKTGGDLFDEHSQEQLKDFSTHAPDGERVAFHLIVPGGWREEAARAIVEAGGQVDDYVEIYELPESST